MRPPMTKREPQLQPGAGTPHESRSVGEAIGKLYALMDAAEELVAWAASHERSDA